MDGTRTGGSLPIRRDEVNDLDLRFIGGISVALGLRQVALLAVLPFIAIYARNLPGGTPAWAGAALGIYGLMQGVLQIPLGALSDSVGRKRIVLVGTALLVAGMLVAAVARDVLTLTLGRAIQGAGAVNGAAYAWVADRTSGKRLNQAMGTISAAVGLAAIASFIGGPLLYALVSMRQIFLLCAVLALGVGVYVAVAMPEQPAPDRDHRGPPSSALWRTPMLWQLVAAGFLANYVLMAVSFGAPLLLSAHLGTQLWKALIPAALAGVAGMRAATAASDRGYVSPVISLSFLTFLPSAFSLLSADTLVVAAGTALFMAGYLSLSALLPAGVNRVAGAEARGRANGAYHTGAFLGSFAGAVVTGVLWGIRPSLAVGMMVVAWAGGQFLAARMSPQFRRMLPAGA